MALQAAMVHPTVRIASFDDWKVVEEKAWVVLGGKFWGSTVIYKERVAGRDVARPGACNPGRCEGKVNFRGRFSLTSHFEGWISGNP